MLRALVVCLVIAGFTPAPARSAEWKAGDVEAAERYRALERERALRYRAALERRAGRAEAPAPRRERETGSRQREHEAKARRDAQRLPQRERERRALPGRAGERGEERQALFEPWVERLATRALDALWRAMEDVASALWRDLRAWLEATLAAALGDETRAGPRDAAARS